MKRKHKRLTFVFAGIGILGIAALLVLTALEESVTFFRTPTELVTNAPDTDIRLRLGGLVEEGSVARGSGTTVEFRVTDLDNSVPVRFTGILPDLFREGQGVVAEGRMTNGVFVAEDVLAKHDETYMPPEAAEALKRSGQWQHMQRSTGETEQLPKTVSQ